MRVGFTGTQKGTTPEQRQELRQFLYSRSVDEFHHGDCIGADAEAHAIVRDYRASIRIIIHPPTNKTRVANRTADEWRVSLPYLERNKAIVDACDVLVAMPFETVEKIRSGTWSTIRYARKQDKPIYIILPDGRVRLENESSVLK